MREKDFQLEEDVVNKVLDQQKQWHFPMIYLMIHTVPAGSTGGQSRTGEWVTGTGHNKRSMSWRVKSTLAVILSWPCDLGQIVQSLRTPSFLI